MLKRRPKRRRNATQMNIVAAQVLEMRELKTSIAASLIEVSVAAAIQQTATIDATPTPTVAVNAAVGTDLSANVSPGVPVQPLGLGPLVINTPSVNTPPVVANNPIVNNGLVTQVGGEASGNAETTAASTRFPAVSEKDKSEFADNFLLVLAGMQGADADDVEAAEVTRLARQMMQSERGFAPTITIDVDPETAKAAGKDASGQQTNGSTNPIAFGTYPTESEFQAKYTAMLTQPLVRSVSATESPEEPDQLPDGEAIL